MYDVIIVGAGPAGQNAALVLGRCRRHVLLCDHGKPRNAASPALHGFLSRDGIDPLELLRIGREQLATYPSVEYRHVEVENAVRTPDGFRVEVAGGAEEHARMLLLATGVVDRLPDIEDAETHYGRGLYHCPYCDGWEVRDRRLAAYGKRSLAVDLAIELTCWSEDIMLFTDGKSEIADRKRLRLEELNIPIREDRVVRLEGAHAGLAAVILEDGTRVPRDAMFFKTAFRQRSDICERLGCAFTEQGAVDTGTYESTNVPGLYVAGDASKHVQLAIVAAAEGAGAAFAINNALIVADSRP